MSTHKNMTGADLHENKGVSTAANGEVATAQGGVTDWKKLTADNLTGTGNPFGGNQIHVVQRKAASVNAGTLTANVWTDRVWTNRLVNQITGVTWSDQDITLPAGTYQVRAAAIGYNCGFHQLRLVTTTGTVLVYGLLARTTDGVSAATAQQSVAELEGQFTIATSKTVNLQHISEGTVAGAGQGKGTTFGIGQFAFMSLWQVA